PQALHRRFPVGAEVQPGGGVHFRVWAPACRSVEVVDRDPAGPEAERGRALEPEPGGYFAGLVPEMGAGSRYSFCLDGDRGALVPDPTSRFQPEGPHGPSEVVDASTFPWTDATWRGLRPAGQVIYEIHIGTFTPEGTWQAAAREL